jgi:hypothetical protein
MTALMVSTPSFALISLILAEVMETAFRTPEESLFSFH